MKEYDVSEIGQQLLSLTMVAVDASLRGNPLPDSGFLFVLLTCQDNP